MFVYASILNAYEAAHSSCTTMNKIVQGLATQAVSDHSRIDALCPSANLFMRYQCKYLLHLQAQPMFSCIYLFDSKARALPSSVWQENRIGTFLLKFEKNGGFDLDGPETLPGE
jgi:hypothetical protein